MDTETHDSRRLVVLGANAVLLLLVLTVSFLVNGNGELPGVPELLSRAIAVGVFVLAICGALVLALRTSGFSRVPALGLLLFYAAMVLPVFM
jgi:hypothetical protein